MAWLYLSLLPPLLWACVNTVDKVVVGKYIDKAVVYLVLTGLASLIPIIILPAFCQIDGITPFILGLSILTGVLYIWYSWFFFRSLQLSDAPVVANLLLLVPVFTLLLGTFLFDERFSPTAYVGIAFVLAGVLGVSTEKRDAAAQGKVRGISLTPAFLLMLISAVITSIAYALQKYILLHTTELTLFYFSRIGVLGAALGIVICSKEKRRQFFSTMRHIPSVIIPVSACNELLDMIAAFSLMAAYDRGSLSLITTIISIQPIFVLFLVNTLNKVKPGLVPSKGDSKLFFIRLAFIVLTVLGVYFISSEANAESRGQSTSTQANASAGHTDLEKTPQELSSHSKQSSDVPSQRLNTLSAGMRLNDEDSTSQPASNAQLSAPAGNVAVETTIILWTMIILFLTMVILIWQTWLTRVEMRKNAVRNIYERYLEINKLEVEYPILHEMFMDAETLDKLQHLSDEEMRKRALSLFIFDQFALIYNLGERPTLYRKIDPYLRRLLGKGWLLQWWNDFVDRKRSLLDINESYVHGIMSNPEVVKCWREYGLGKTWYGSRYFDFINQLIDEHRRDMEEKTTSMAVNSNRIIETYDATAKDYAQAFCNEETLQAELHYLKQFLSLVKKGGNILDAGCGPGIETEFITNMGFHYEGIDASVKMIEIARARNPSASFTVMDMRAMSFPDAQFDGIIALES